MNNELVFGSIGHIAANNGKSVAYQFTFDVKAVLVIDISASMAAHDCAYGHSRYAVAVQELERLQRSIPGKVAIVEFSTTALFAPGGIPSPPQASTNMAGALQFIKPIDGTGIDIWVISDGAPDDERATLNEARTFQTKINTVYIGPEDGTGADFLRRLSALTGGVNATQSVREIAHLSDTMQKLLTA